MFIVGEHTFLGHGLSRLQVTYEFVGLEINSIKIICCGIYYIVT